VQASRAGRRDRDDVAAPVVRVRGALDEPASGQLVDCRDDIAAVHDRAAAEPRLAGRPELLQRGEQAVVVAARVSGREPLGQQPV